MALPSAIKFVALLTFIASGAWAAPRANDPCVKVAGKSFVAPVDALACLKSFPFNETIRQNVLAVVSGVFDFYTFEAYYLNSPPPFQESTTDIRAEIQRINNTNYETDYDFNKDLYQFITMMNDGHTRWLPACYWSAYQNILPAPHVILEVDGAQNVYVAPDSVEYLSQLGPDFLSYFEDLDFNWQRLAGAKVLNINELDPFDYIDAIAHNTSGNYLDHGVRVNSVVSGYRIGSTNAYSQRLGDLAGPSFPEPASLRLTLKLVNKTEPETFDVPYAASFLGTPFTDGSSYWENNCAANNATNGIDFSNQDGLASTRTSDLVSRHPGARRRRASGKMVDGSTGPIALPSRFQPSVPTIAGGSGVAKSYILPDKKTGVLFIGSFEPDDEKTFQQDIDTSVRTFKKAGVTQMIVDVTANGGGLVCLGLWLHEYLAGSDKVPVQPGFQSSVRANTLAQKIIKSDIARNITPDEAFYAPSTWASVPNDVAFDNNHNYITPPLPFSINGESQPTSQRFFDICDANFSVPFPKEPPVPLNKIVIVGNGNCASTCALFTTLMHELHGVRNIIFGGKPGERLQYKGLAGNQVLEWADLDSEIKTAHVKDDPLAPPDLIVNANMRINWRTAYSFLDEAKPIAYVSELASVQFPYTPETYNNPQAVWEFVAKTVF